MSNTYAVIYRGASAGESTGIVARLGTEAACEAARESVPEWEGHHLYTLPVEVRRGGRTPAIGESVAVRCHARTGDPLNVEAPRASVRDAKFPPGPAWRTDWLGARTRRATVREWLLGDLIERLD